MAVCDMPDLRTPDEVALAGLIRQQPPGDRSYPCDKGLTLGSLAYFPVRVSLINEISRQSISCRQKKEKKHERDKSQKPSH